MDGDGPTIPQFCLDRLSIKPAQYLGGRVNWHWLVEKSSDRFVLRGYPEHLLQDVEYEHDVMRRLHELGWPVPTVVEGPISGAGRLWCLLVLLPGAPRAGDDPDERTDRGQLLAELHQATSTFPVAGQRTGFQTADELVHRVALMTAVREYEQLRPRSGHILRWHLDQVCEAFDRIELEDAETMVVHSDFATWNLLYEDGRLSGVLDFDGTHQNYRVSDFALSWRGYQDEVIEGYERVHPLSDLDRQLLGPCYWSWLFIGVEREVAGMVSGDRPIHDFDWQVNHLLRRPRLFADPLPPYAGPRD